MSISTIHTRASVGVQAPLVSVETHISNGLPALAIVGMPETAVKESKERVRSALINAGFEFPARRITINLAPADLPKQGGRYDLAIALGILVATKQLPEADVGGYEFFGELGLTGDIRSVSAMLPSVIAATADGHKVWVPEGNLAEACLADQAKVYTSRHLNGVCAHLSGKDVLESVQHPLDSTGQHKVADLEDVKGQMLPRRALEIAAAGSLNLLLFGPPGTGKSMLAERLPGILPLMSEQEALEVASLFSIKGLFDPKAFKLRPFRSPHHSCSATALIGGGAQPLPGEVSLAHSGVLFLDELPEFGRKALEMLREPIETGEVTIARARQSISYPANFQLLAAMNPCPCGYLGHPTKECSDTPQQIAAYRRKLSGPLLDRFDMHVEVTVQPASLLFGKDDRRYESTEAVAKRVLAARERQCRRQGSLNSQLSGKKLERHAVLTGDLQHQLEYMMDKFSLSPRSVHRIMRVARTIADLNEHECIEGIDLKEALAYRGLDKTNVR